MPYKTNCKNTPSRFCHLHGVKILMKMPILYISGGVAKILQDVFS